MRRLLIAAVAAILCAAPASADVTYQAVYGRITLTSTSPTACTSLWTLPAHGLQVVNASAIQTNTLNVYDEGASPTCAAADLVYSQILPANAAVTLGTVGISGSSPVFFTKGLAYSLSGAATGTISLQLF